MTTMPIEWEEGVERRIGIAEQKIDKLMDPETGIYPKLSQIEGRLVRWAVGILTTLVGIAALEILQLIGARGK